MFTTSSIEHVSTYPVLKCAQGAQPALQGVSVQAAITGWLMQTSLRQNYVNDTHDELELTYTFPLAYGMVLLGMNLDINDQRLHAQVLPKNNAQFQYEAAIESGNTPVLVEASGNGTYTANLGNLKPGEKACIEIIVGQALSLEQGRVRVTVPTVIAPKYGDAIQDGGLQAHQTFDTRIDVEYTFDIEVTIKGDLAKGEIGSPSHLISTQLDDDTTIVRLQDTAHLDRDFVLTISDLAQDCAAVCAPDHDAYMSLLSFCPSWQIQEDTPLRMKILVDCSGSMAGDSIAQARAALNAISAELNATDQISFSKFGTHPTHPIKGLTACTPAMLSSQFAEAVAETDADMGGTDMALALEEVIVINSRLGSETKADVLLITDGEIWGEDRLIQLAKALNHRVFVVGVGSTPADGLLHKLADTTGGSVEFVNPNENMMGAIQRMFHRIRQGRHLDLDIQWNDTPIWASQPPRLIVPGETVHLCAQHTVAPKTCAIQWRIDGQAHHCDVSHVDIDDQVIVTRLAGTKRMNESTSGSEREALAIRYALVSDTTSLLLVYERNEQEQAQGMPVLQQTPQMLAAGHGGASSARMLSTFVHGVSAQGAVTGHRSSSANVPRLWCLAHRSQPRPHIDASLAEGVSDFEIPSFLRKIQGEEAPPVKKPFVFTPTLPPQQWGSRISPAIPTKSPTAFLRHATAELIIQDVPVEDLADHCGLDKLPELQSVFDALLPLCDSVEQTWALLLMGLYQAIQSPMPEHPTKPITSQELRSLRTRLARVSHETIEHAKRQILSAYPGLQLITWGHTSASSEA